MKFSIEKSSTQKLLFHYTYSSNGKIYIGKPLELKHFFLNTNVFENLSK